MTLIVFSKALSPEQGLSFFFMRLPRDINNYYNEERNLNYNNILGGNYYEDVQE